MQPPKIDWSAALAQHDRWLRTVIYARLQQPEAVEDVLQEVALAAVRQSAPINDHTKVAPWLYRLAVTQSLLYRRKLARRRRLTDRFANQPAEMREPERYPDPLGWLLAEERQKLVREALGRLPPRDAEILMLKYTENWSYHEIAAHMGISHSAVEARLHRARGKMREQLLANESIGSPE